MTAAGDTTGFTIYVTAIILVTTIRTVCFLRDRSLDEPELNQVQPGT